MVADVFDSRDYRQDAANVADSYSSVAAGEVESQPDSIPVEPSWPKALVAVGGLGMVLEAVGASYHGTYSVGDEAEEEAGTLKDSAVGAERPVEEVQECIGSGNPRPVLLKHISALVDSQLVFAVRHQRALQNDKHLEDPSSSQLLYSLLAVVVINSGHLRRRCFRQ